MDARWSARFGAARSVRATCVVKVALVRDAPASRRRRVDGVWDVERCVEICSAGESRQKSSQTLICALRFYQAVSGHLKALGFLQR